MGMLIIVQSLVLVSKIAQFTNYAAGLIYEKFWRDKKSIMVNSKMVYVRQTSEIIGTVCMLQKYHLLSFYRKALVLQLMDAVLAPFMSVKDVPQIISKMHHTSIFISLQH